jgi:hypothetical protein
MRRANTILLLRTDFPVVKVHVFCESNDCSCKVCVQSSIDLRNKSWKPESVLSFNMGWRILVFYPEPDMS